MKSILALATEWLLLLPSGALAFDIVPITNNNTDDWDPAIAGSRVVWAGCVGTTGSSCSGGHYEVFFWDGSFPIAPIQITNSTGSGQPAISGSNVVWISSDGNDAEIYLWDGSFPIVPVQITNNSRDDQHPVISGSSVAWDQCDVDEDNNQCPIGDTEIYYWDGSYPIVPVQITDNDSNDVLPSISGSTVVWKGYADTLPIRKTDIFHWDGGAISQLTDYNDALVRQPDISGSTVVWKGPLEEPQILRWDGTFPVVPSAIPGSGGTRAAISGSNVVWRQGPTGDTNIYFWDGLMTTNVTNNNHWHNDDPDVSGSMVVWSGCAYSPEIGCVGDEEIYLPEPTPSLGLAAGTLGLLLVGFVGGRRRP